MEESKNKSNYFAAIAVLIILCFGLLVHKLLKAQERITLLESNNNDLINKVVVGQLKSSLVNHHFSLTDAGNLSTAPPSCLFRKQEIDVFILFLIYLLKGEIRSRTKSVNGFPRYLDILPYLVSFMGVSRSNGIYQ